MSNLYIREFLSQGMTVNAPKALALFHLLCGPSDEPSVDLNAMSFPSSNWRIAHMPSQFPECRFELSRSRGGRYAYHFAEVFWR
jgi:hypothetical protein